MSCRCLRRRRARRICRFWGEGESRLLGHDGRRCDIAHPGRLRRPSRLHRTRPQSPGFAGAWEVSRRPPPLAHSRIPSILRSRSLGRSDAEAGQAHRPRDRRSRSRSGARHRWSFRRERPEAVKAPVPREAVHLQPGCFERATQWWLGRRRKMRSVPLRLEMVASRRERETTLDGCARYLSDETWRCSC